MNWYKTCGQPRYEGQLQGDENRTAPDSLNERLLDNEIIEGEYVNKLRSLMQGGYDKYNKQLVEDYIKELEQKGHSINRIQSMLTRAMYKMKL